VHFYHLSALDWVDVVSALKADPAKASQVAESLSEWPHNGRLHLKAVQERLRVRRPGTARHLRQRVLGPPGDEALARGEPAGRGALPAGPRVPAAANQVVAILGSKTPNIQNLAVGGVANAINLDNEATLNMTKLYTVKVLLAEHDAFIEQVYFPTSAPSARCTPTGSATASGVTTTWPCPTCRLDAAGTTFDMPGGTIMNGDLGSTGRSPSRSDRPVLQGERHREHRARLVRRRLDEAPLGRRDRPEVHRLRADGKYSWIKAPRFNGEVMQVGPLAQVLVGVAQGTSPHDRWATRTLQTAGKVPARHARPRSCTRRSAATPRG
jgi:hydrogenase large subunit